MKKPSILPIMHWSLMSVTNSFITQAKVAPFYTMRELTLPVNHFRSDHGRREKINLIFYNHTSLWCLKRFFEGLRKTFWEAFIKPFEAPQRSVRTKILGLFLFWYNFLKCTGQERLTISFIPFFSWKITLRNHVS